MTKLGLKSMLDHSRSHQAMSDRDSGTGYQTRLQTSTRSRAISPLREQQARGEWRYWATIRMAQAKERWFL